MAISDEFLWQKDSACAEHPEMNFFPSESNIREVNKVKKVCRGCLVKDECLEYAYKNHVVDGIWGGFTYKERKKVGPFINLKKEMLRKSTLVTTSSEPSVKFVLISPKPFVLRVPSDNG